MLLIWQQQTNCDVLKPSKQICCCYISFNNLIRFTFEIKKMISVIKKNHMNMSAKLNEQWDIPMLLDCISAHLESRSANQIIL